MRTQPYKGFVGQTYSGRAPTAATDRTINWAPERPVGAGSPEAGIYFNPTPGYKLFGTLPAPATKVQELYTDPKSGRVFAASQGVLYEIDSVGTVTTIGNIGVGPYSFASNPVGQVMICSGGSGTSMVLVGTTLTAPGGTFLGSSMIDYDDTYFLSLVPNSDQIQISPLLDGLVGWSGLDFGSAVGSAENLKVLKVIHREVWLFGSKRGEVYVNTGNPSFPFERLNGVYIEHGIKAAKTLKILDNTLFWLGEGARGEGTVWRAEGYTPTRVSTHAVEYWIAKFAKEGTIEDAEAYAIEEEGHFLYMLHFPSAFPVVTYMGMNQPVTVYMGAMFCYDVTTGMWHERMHWDSSVGMWEGFRGRSHTFAFGKHLIGDWKTGKIYEMSPDYFTDDGEPLRRLRVAPHVTNGLRRITYPEFRLNIQVGGGNVNDVDPHIDMRTSDDGGMTWSNSRSRSVGAAGHYKEMVRWMQCGQARRRAFEVSTTMDAPCTLLDAYLPGLIESND